MATFDRAKVRVKHRRPTRYDMIHKIRMYTSVEEVAKALHVTEETVRTWCRELSINLGLLNSFRG